MRSFFGFRRLVISFLMLISAMTAFTAPAHAGDDCYSRSVGAWYLLDDPTCMLELSRTVTSGPDSITLLFFHEGNGRYQLSVNAADYTSSLTAVSVDYPGSAAIPAPEMSYYGRYTADTGTEIAAALYTGGTINIYVTYSNGRSAVFSLNDPDFRLAIDSVT